METTMQAEAQTTERSGSPVVSMIEALGQRAENLRALPAGEVDAFNRDVEALHASLKRISDDLKASFHICPHLGQRVISEKARRDLFRDLESDEQLLEKIRGKLMALCECLLETEEVLKVLPELTAMRSALDAISDAGRRRTARNHLDNCRDLQEDLLEWKKSARRGLEKIIESGLPETFDIDLSLPGQEPDASPPRASSRKRRAAAGPSRRASPPDCGGREARSAPYRRNRAEEPREPESAPAPLPRRSEDAAARVDSDPLRSRVRDYLNRWSAWHPLAPSRLGDRVQIARPATETLKILRICALWGERRIENASSQTRVEGESDTRLWDLPCSPPPAFRTGREKRRPTPPQGVLVACPSCSEQAEPACPRCGGRGMILAAGDVETTYRSADLIEASGGRALPRWLARSSEGSRLFWDFLSEPALHRD
ncbi:MAG: hypothetical protein JXA90_11490, partial [Planctomycetes bacterium]|nr:hypothetical protein [Planctomycetota bacterium]